MPDMKKWQNVVITMANRPQFDKLEVHEKCGAYLGYGLAFVAEVPLLGGFMDGMAMGYVAQRQLLQEEKLEEAKKSLGVKTS